MIPFVYTILAWEKALEMKRQGNKMQESEIIISKPAPCHKPKDRERFSSRPRPQIPCDRS